MAPLSTRALTQVGGWSINEAIMNHVRRHRGLEIGAHTAERLKIELGSATIPEDLAKEIQINGRDLLTGSPAAIEITAGEIYPVINELIRKIEDFIATALTEVPPEVAGDIYARGIILTGGGADERFARLETGHQASVIGVPGVDVADLQRRPASHHCSAR
jgi:rod shape-determining protein MreB